ncbi:MAG: nitroreductase family protein [Candidatus Sumerlaeales bacterium]|nr:nitroreductase family protein [Candidatus Sumerlaeales bacterium]
MQFEDLVNKRQSTRKYKNTNIADDQILKICEVINKAPSAGNLQDYEIVAVKDSAKRQQLAKLCFNQAFIASAPVVFVFLSNPSRSRAVYGDLADSLFACQDATIACAYAELTVTNMGYAACWIGGGDDDGIHRLLDLPTEWKTVAVLCVGIADESPERTTRREVSSIYKII